jgi:lysophospholipase L1-like esterase
VLAFGDSITNGGGELQYGQALQSWALWTARGLGVPYTPYAADGATVADVTEHQIPAFLATCANPDARYELGCLYIGTNDIRMPEWDPDEFAARFSAALDFLAARCDRVLTMTIPLDMGRPRNPLRVAEVNREIELVAERHGALVVELRAFAARNLIMADHIHPTAYGQIAIAERALDVLSADGMQVRVRPSQMVRLDIGRRERLRADLTYAYRSMKVAFEAWFVSRRS